MAPPDCLAPLRPATPRCGNDRAARSLLPSCRRAGCRQPGSWQAGAQGRAAEQHVILGMDRNERKSDTDVDGISWDLQWMLL